ncbi:High mobility group protein DSP1 [Geodia barretti]|nr:High mobility group protein DSP1 [Geodia barretti]
MDLVSVPGVAGPSLAPRITFSYAPVNMQSLADGGHVARDAAHPGHGHSHGHGAHGQGHGAHGHGAHGHSHAPPHTPGHGMPPPGPPSMGSHQGTPHPHQPPPPPPSAPSHSHSHGQDHPSASATGSTLDAIESFIQQERANMIIPTPTSERPRIRGRMTPYAFFVQERREYYRQQGVPVQFTAFSKECSSLWKVISEEEKQKYQKLAEEDRERYRREVMGDYGKGASKGGSRRGRRKKEPGQPKRNMCAFLHFCSAKRPKLKQENPSLSVGSLAKQLSSAWKLMTPEQKKPYDLLAEKDKQRYEQQKQAYEAGYSAAILKTDVPGGSVGQPGMVMSAPRHRRRKKDPDMPRRNM